MTYLARSVVAATGVTTTFSVPFPFIVRDDVVVTLDDAPQAFTWLNDGAISITPAPTGNLVIQRFTEVNQRLVDFSNTSGLDESDLDLSATQLFYLIQELYDNVMDLLDFWEEIQDILESLQDQIDAIVAMFENYYTKVEVDALFEDYYTKDEVDDLLDGVVGQPGADGKSAYEIAVENGFVGTEAEWLESLQGADGTNGTDGADGQDGKSAYEIAVENGFVGTEVEWLASLQGADGADGAPGPQGEAGASGGFTNFAIFRATGAFNFSVPVGKDRITVELWGAGAGGSRVAADQGGSTFYKGSGGGGGAYQKTLILVTAGDLLTGTVGAKGVGAGTGAQAGSDMGGNGGESTLQFGSTWTATAGGGIGANGLARGTGGSVATTLTGSNPSLGTVIEAVAGQAGQSAVPVASGAGATTLFYSGSGGDGARGGAGGLGRLSVPSSAGDLGTPGIAPGGAGSGADEQGNGGDGADGLVIIWY